MSVLVSRVLQSLTHVCLVQTNAVVSVRFAFFLVQLVGFVSLTVMVVRRTGVVW